MKYTRKQLVKILNDANVTTTAKSIAHLMIVCMDNNLVTKEDIIKADTINNENQEDGQKEKRPRGRPRREGPPQEKASKGYVNARTVRLTNQETGEITEYRSLHKAKLGTGHGHDYFTRNNGKIINGILYEVQTPSSANIS